jgi:hypothetical protein
MITAVTKKKKTPKETLYRWTGVKTYLQSSFEWFILLCVLQVHLLVVQLHFGL